MVMVRTFRSRGSTITVTAAAEVTMMPGGDFYTWLDQFERKAARAAAFEAPTNKRPRWAHYGKPLKSTMISAHPRFRKLPGRDVQRIYGAVGSTSPHALYPDQGTGIYGKGAYQAKILPPWERQSPSLYEHTWKVPKGSFENKAGEREPLWEELGTITIKGQRPQFFMDTAIRKAFRQMRTVSSPTPVPGFGEVVRSWPASMEGFLGNTRADSGFLASLKEWREWRDRAWREGRVLGQGYNKERERREYARVKAVTRKRVGRSMAEWRDRKAKNAARQQRWRDAQKAKTKSRPKRSAVLNASQRRDKQAFLAAMQRKYQVVEKNTVRYEKGYWYVTVGIKDTQYANGLVFKEVRAKAKS